MNLDLIHEWIGGGWGAEVKSKVDRKSMGGVTGREGWDQAIQSGKSWEDICNIANTLCFTATVAKGLHSFKSCLEACQIVMLENAVTAS